MLTVDEMDGLSAGLMVVWLVVKRVSPMAGKLASQRVVPKDGQLVVSRVVR